MLYQIAIFKMFTLYHNCSVCDVTWNDAIVSRTGCHMTCIIGYVERQTEHALFAHRFDYIYRFLITNWTINKPLLQTKTALKVHFTLPGILTAAVLADFPRAAT